jgi:hypothetical protein
MANPYHDADGKFASHDELNEKVQKAYDDGRMDDYIRERKNLEDIERKRFKEENPFNRSTPPRTASVATIRTQVERRWDTEEDIWEAQGNPTYFGLVTSGGITSEGKMSALAATPEHNSFNEETINHHHLGMFSLRGTPKGVEEIHKQALSENAQNLTTSYDTVPDNPGAAPVTLTVHNADISSAQREAAEQHIKNMKKHREFLETSNDVKSAAIYTISEVRQKREELTEKLKATQYELAYLMNNTDTSTENWSHRANDKFVVLITDAQKYHDDVMYTHLAEDQLRKYTYNR